MCSPPNGRGCIQPLKHPSRTLSFIIFACWQILSEGDTHRLIIPEVFPEDSGLFMCRARNSFGIAECTAELYVEGLSDYTTDDEAEMVVYDNYNDFAC